MKGKGKNWKRKLIFIIGFLLCCYPLVSSLIEQQYQKSAVATYQQSVQDKDDSEIKEIIQKATEYNDMLFQTDGAIVGDVNSEILSEESYESLLNQGTGVMGSIEIPKIGVDLPIYHGTDDDVLSNGIGHLEGTSLPVGGASTHCVLTGHRGLPNSKLFTRLDEIEENDLFYLNIFGETLAYKVNQIEVIEPDEVDKLNIQEGKDLVSLITCTPYGLNTHRLVVTGERVSYEKKVYENIKPNMLSGRELIFGALPFIFIGIQLISFIRQKMKERKRNEAQNNP
ncbi:MAG: class C sortase [Lachnospiraceae bacterium]|nr:class C sortase [Lachnospiraceae bacterium]